MKKQRHSRGFTLIELLVVIAIIGILASVILISLSAARGKASDVKVISDVKQIRVALEADLGGNAAYPDLTNTPGSQIAGGLDINSAATSTFNPLLSDLYNAGGSLNIVNTPNSGPVVGYAIYGQLISTSTLYFCMDSSGNNNPQAANNTAPTCN